MDVPMEISFRGLDKSDAVEDLIRRKAAKLDQISNNITSLRVVVEDTQKSQESGNPYRVRLELNVKPGKEIVIKRGESDGHIHNDIPTMVRDAFEAATRKVKKITDKQRGKVKKHPEQMVNGIVSKLFPEEDYGFLRSADERDVYFHRNSIVGRDLEDLKPGTGVSFTATQGEKGLQATAVHVVDNPSL